MINPYYKNMDKQDIEVLLNKFTSLTLESKIALKNIINERYKKDDFNNELVTALNKSIIDKLDEYKDLKYLDDLGYSLLIENENLILQRSSRAKLVDLFGVIISIVLILTLSYSLAKLYISYSNGKLLTLSNLPFVIGLITGGYGFALFVRVFDRILKYKGFILRKNSSNIWIKYRLNFRLDQLVIPTDVKFKIKTDEDITRLFIEYKEHRIDIALIKNPNLGQTETLNSLLVTLNA